MKIHQATGEYAFTSSLIAHDVYSLNECILNELIQKKKIPYLTAELHIWLHRADPDVEAPGLFSQQWIKPHFPC